MLRLAACILAIHFLAPLLYYFLFEQYGGDDIIWHARNVSVFTFLVGSMVLCPILVTGIFVVASRRKRSLLEDGLLEIWVVDMLYTMIGCVCMLFPAVY